MEQPRDRELDNVSPPVSRRDVEIAPPAATARPVVQSDTVLLRDRIRWGPIIAGMLTTITTMLLLSLLGLAIGLSALEPAEAGTETVGIGAAIWAGASAIIAFFLGGWIAARSSAVAGGASGLLNGIMAGVATLALTIWLVGSGLGGLLGIAATNLGDILNVAENLNLGGVDAGAIGQDAYNNARDGALGTLIGLVLALGAAALGGLVGRHDQSEIIQSAPPPGSRAVTHD